MRRRSANRRFASWPLGRRLIALVAAYTIALSSLIVSYEVARAAIPDPGTITCHSEAGGTTAPADGEHDGMLCDASCCIGCLMLIVAVPPPPAAVAEAPRSFGRPMALAAAITLGAVAHTTSHQSRAPPQLA